MRWLEMIMVRSAVGKAGVLVKTLQDLMADMSKRSGSEDIRIYRREKIETDFCIVLFHSGKKTRTGGSPLGLRMVAAFKEVGLVHHAIWHEMAR